MFNLVKREIVFSNVQYLGAGECLSCIVVMVDTTEFEGLKAPKTSSKISRRIGVCHFVIVCIVGLGEPERSRTLKSVMLI